jgi:predicted homoserine dehydrogenase-like protein
MYDELQRRAEEGRPVRIALIGAGKFGSMFLSQARRVAGLHLVGVADLSRTRAIASLERVGWPIEQYGARSAREALESGATYLTEDAETLISVPEIDVVVDATGHPASGIRHALLFRGDVQAVSSDRPGTRHFRLQHRLAGRDDGSHPAI